MTYIPKNVHKGDAAAGYSTQNPTDLADVITGIEDQLLVLTSVSSYRADTIAGAVLADEVHASLAAAVSTIGSDERTILIGDSITINEDVIIPSNIQLRFEQEGVLNISGSYTVTIRGSVTSYLRQIFTGTGNVLFECNQTIYPEWWGAVDDATGSPNEGTDNTTAFNKAFNSLVGTYQNQVIISGYHRVKYPFAIDTIVWMPVALGAASEEFPYAICPVPSNTEVIFRAGAKIFHDFLTGQTGISGSGMTQVPMVFSVSGDVENISFQNVDILGRSENILDGPTSGMGISVNGLSYNSGSDAWDLPVSADAVPKNISIEHSRFELGRAGISIRAAYNEPSYSTHYSPQEIKLNDIYCVDQEHHIEIFGLKSTSGSAALTASNLTLHRKNYVQRGIGTWFSSDLLIENVFFIIDGITGLANGIKIGPSPSVPISCDNITVRGVKANITVGTPGSEWFRAVHLDASAEADKINNVSVSDVFLPNDGNVQIETLGSAPVILSNIYCDLLGVLNTDNVLATNIYAAWTTINTCEKVAIQNMICDELDITNSTDVTISNMSGVAQTRVNATGSNRITFNDSQIENSIRSCLNLGTTSNVTLSRGTLKIPDVQFNYGIILGASTSNVKLIGVDISTFGVTVATHTGVISLATGITNDRVVIEDCNIAVERLLRGDGILTGFRLKNNIFNPSFNNTLYWITSGTNKVQGFVGGNKGLDSFSPIRIGRNASLETLWDFHDGEWSAPQMRSETQTLLTTDNGAMIVNGVYASGTVTYTLPTLDYNSQPLEFTFGRTATYTVSILPPSGGRIRGTSANNQAVSLNSDGAFIKLVHIYETYWEVVASTGTIAYA